MTLAYTGKFSLSTDVISQHLMDETLLLNVTGLAYYRLDSLGGSLWQLLEEYRDMETVVAELISF